MNFEIPFWETGWFLGGITLILCTFFLLVYRQRTRSIHNHTRQLEKEVADRTRQLEILNSVAMVTSRSLDLSQVLVDALDKTLELTEIEAGGIYLLREGEDILNIAAFHGLDNSFVDEIDHLSIGEGFSGRVVQTGETLIIPDVSKDPRLTRSIVQKNGFHALAVVPLSSRGNVLGSMFLISKKYRDFPKHEIGLLNSIGIQIGVAVENARLFQVEKRRADQFLVITEVSHHFTSTLEINDLLEQVVSLIQQTFGYYHVGIGLIEGDEVVYRVGKGVLWSDPKFQFKPSRLKIGIEGLTGWVAAHGESLLVPDVSKDERYVLMQGSKAQSELLVPIIVKGQILGVLDVQSDRLNAFDQRDIVMVQSLANQAGTAIENARLYERAGQVAVLEERQRLARELHDSVTQALYGMTLYAQAAQGQLSQGNFDKATENLIEIQDTAQDALSEMRLLIYELRPPVLEQEGLFVALQTRLAAVEGRAGLKTSLKSDLSHRLPLKIEEGLYRIAQEALNNTLKHAHARTIAVTLCQDGDGVVLDIADDGSGFDPQAVSGGGGMGLRTMRERTAALGGVLTVRSNPGEGTQVRMEITP